MPFKPLTIHCTFVPKRGNQSQNLSDNLNPFLSHNLKICTHSVSVYWVKKVINNTYEITS